jgi:hypothetical protein
MKLIKSLFAMSAVALAAATVPMAHAGIGDVYSSTFQGLTFTFTQTDADTLKFEIAGTPSGDWSTAQYLAAFDLKDLGLDFSTVTGTANGPGAVNLAGLNTQLSASSVDCLAAGNPPGSICFDVAPDVALGSLPFDFIYTIDFSSALNIASTGPHLQIAFSETQNGPKIGSLYSQSVGLSSSSGLTSSSGLASSSGTVPEPNSGALALLGIGLLGAGFARRFYAGRS